MRVALASLLLLAHSVAGSAQEPATEPAPAPAELPVVCTIEEECFPLLPNLARREGASLILTLADGTTKTLTDNREACADVGADGCVTYLLGAYMPASGVFLVDFQSHETGGVLVIEIANGASFELSTQPVFSPSGQRLVSTDAGEGRPYDVTVWSRYQGQWIDQLRQLDSGATARLWGIPKWTGEDVVTSSVTDAAGVPKGDAKVIWDGQGWVMQVP